MKMLPFEISFDIVAIISVALAGLGYIYNKIVKPSIRLTKKILESQDKIDKIYTELHTNGGSSIKDAINRIELRLLGVEHKQNLYLLETPQAIWETDGKGKCTSVNRTFCRLVGKTEKELLGMGWLNSIDEEDRDHVLKSWEEAVEQQIEFILKYNMVDIDGVKFKVNSVAYPMEHPISKEIIGWIGTITLNNN